MSSFDTELVESQSESERRGTSSLEKEIFKSGDKKDIEEMVNENTEIELRKKELGECNWYELICAVLAGLIFIALHYVPGKIKNPLYILFVFISFGTWIYIKCRRYGYKLILNDWGLTIPTTTFKITFFWCTIIGVIGVIGCVIYMAIFKTGLDFDYDLIIMFVLYPIWGVIQQFLIQAMIAINLTKAKFNYYLAIFLTAISFTLVHFPHIMLMIPTFLLGAGFTPIFLKYKCLYPLGIYHGWCGAVLYWLVLDEDPLLRFK